jgi:hypothetical protein
MSRGLAASVDWSAQAVGHPFVHSVLHAIEQSSEMHFGTLTSRRDYSSEAMSEELRRCFYRLNRALYGPAFTRRGMRVATYAVHELNSSQGRHAHILFGHEPSVAWKANPSPVPFGELVVGLWCSLAGGRDRKAQDVRAITDLNGAANYIHKTIKTRGGLDHIDVTNLHIPHVA